MCRVAHTCHVCVVCVVCVCVCGLAGAVYEFVSQSTGRDVANFLLLQPGIPKVEYPIETALTTTLAQAGTHMTHTAHARHTHDRTRTRCLDDGGAELVPRGSITVMNREDKGVVRGAEAEPAMHFRRARYGHAGSDDDDDEGELNADAVDTDAMSYEVCDIYRRVCRVVGRVCVVSVSCLCRVCVVSCVVCVSWRVLC